MIDEKLYSTINDHRILFYLTVTPTPVNDSRGKARWTDRLAPVSSRWNSYSYPPLCTNILFLLQHDADFCKNVCFIINFYFIPSLTILQPHG